MPAKQLCMCQHRPDHPRCLCRTVTTKPASSLWLDTALVHSATRARVPPSGKTSTRDTPPQTHLHPCLCAWVLIRPLPCKRATCPSPFPTTPVSSILNSLSTFPHKQQHSEPCKTTFHTLRQHTNPNRPAPIPVCLGPGPAGCPAAVLLLGRPGGGGGAGLPPPWGPPTPESTRSRSSSSGRATACYSVL